MADYIAKANHTKIQERRDGQCFTAIPAFIRDLLELKGGTILRWTPGAPRTLTVEVVGWVEPERKSRG